MKKNFTLLFLLLGIHTLKAQSRIFNQVAEGVSTTTKTIFQDNAVVGYVAFTKLEKASKDSFSYKLTIMDENLNNIGEQTMKDVNLSLASAGFESDVLCLSFFSSSVEDENFTTKKQMRNARDNAKNTINNKFMTLEGKVIKTQIIEVDANMSVYGLRNNLSISSQIATNGTVKNVANKGFAFMYADNNKGEVMLYDTKGELVWQKTMTKYPINIMLTNSKGVYVLSKTDQYNSVGNYVLNNYMIEDGKATGEMPIYTDRGVTLSVLNFELNPHTNNPYIAGYMVKEKFNNPVYSSFSKLKKGRIKGVYSYTINGTGKKDVVKNYSFYSDLSDTYDKKGKKLDTKYYTIYDDASQDAEGNMHFAGDYIKRKTRIGGTVTSVLFAPLILPPLIYLMKGSGKYRSEEGVVVKQSTKGVLTEERVLETKKSRYYFSKLPYSGATNSYYSIYDPNSKSDYLIYSDGKNNNLYNITTKKAGRKIPIKDGKNYQTIAPAKEGHILVIENNYSEKYTKLSIEPI